MIEDVSLEPPIFEVLAAGALLSKTDTKMDIYALFQPRLQKELKHRTTKLGQSDLRTVRWQMILDFTQDFDLDSDGEEHDHGGASSVDGNDQGSPTLEAPSVSLELSDADPCSHVSQIVDILKTHSTLSGGRQLEMLLRLQTSLRRIRHLVDPLEALFKLILEKASSISVYALVAIAEFYRKVGKSEQGIEVLAIALKRVERVQVLVKYLVHLLMGFCYYDLTKFQEALNSFQEAVKISRMVRQTLLGLGNSAEAQALYWIGNCYFDIGQYKEAFCYYYKVLKAGNHSLKLELKHPAEAELLHWIGRCYFGLNYYKQLETTL